MNEGVFKIYKDIFFKNDLQIKHKLEVKGKVK